MKRGNLAYQYQGRSYTASQLYAKVQRRMQPKNRRARYKTASLTVRLNLETEARQPERWVEVRLVFSAPVRASSSDTWVLFLCTNVVCWPIIRACWSCPIAIGPTSSAAL